MIFGNERKKSLNEIQFKRFFFIFDLLSYAGEGMCCVVGSRYEFSLSLFFRIEQQINDLSKREKRKT